MKQLLIILSILLTVGPAKAAQSCANECIETGKWRLGIALGGGVITNPLHDGDNIPLFLLPDVAWYGESAYFDNGELGYQWLQSKKHGLEVFTRINKERRYFSFWHPANVFSPLEGISTPVGENPNFIANQRLDRVSLDDIQRRKWALDGGIRWHRYFDNGEFTAALATDITGVHQGHNGRLSYRHLWQFGKLKLTLTPSLNWKSSRLQNYYYGLRKEDKVPLQYLYRAKGGWSPTIAFGVTYPVTESWQLLLKGSYQWLNRGMYSSPLVQDKSVRSLFIGVSHKF